MRRDSFYLDPFKAPRKAIIGKATAIFIVLIDVFN